MSSGGYSRSRAIRTMSEGGTLTRTTDKGMRHPSRACNSPAFRHLRRNWHRHDRPMGIWTVSGSYRSPTGTHHSADVATNFETGWRIALRYTNLQSALAELIFTRLHSFTLDLCHPQWCKVYGGFDYKDLCWFGVDHQIRGC